MGFGTALGHNGKSKNNDYAKDRDKAFDIIFGKREGPQLRREYYANYMRSLHDILNGETRAPEQESKRAPFTFGTALGHSPGKDNQKYVNSLNAKYNELFGDG